MNYVLKYEFSLKNFARAFFVFVSLNVIIVMFGWQEQIHYDNI